MTQADLSSRLAELGVSIHRATIAKIENGDTRAENLPVRDLLAFAAALEVAPVHLICPFTDSVPVAVTPKIAAPAALVRAWIRGNAILREDDDMQYFTSHVPPSEYLAKHGLRELASYSATEEKEKEDG